jgi:hypothetical protein
MSFMVHVHDKNTCGVWSKLPLQVFRLRVQYKGCGFRPGATKPEFSQRALNA